MIHIFVTHQPAVGCAIRALPLMNIKLYYFLSLTRSKGTKCWRVKGEEKILSLLLMREILARERETRLFYVGSGRWRKKNKYWWNFHHAFCVEISDIEFLFDWKMFWKNTFYKSCSLIKTLMMEIPSTFIFFYSSPSLTHSGRGLKLALYLLLEFKVRQRKTSLKLPPTDLPLWVGGFRIEGHLGVYFSVFLLILYFVWHPN